jgi:hypothetical protein
LAPSSKPWRQNCDEFLSRSEIANNSNRNDVSFGQHLDDLIRHLFGNMANCIERLEATLVAFDKKMAAAAYAVEAAVARVYCVV